MNVLTYEGIVENGHIRLHPNVHLPDKARVYVVVPNFDPMPVATIFSPRLAHPNQMSDFEKEMVETPADAPL